MTLYDRLVGSLLERENLAFAGLLKRGPYARHVLGAVVLERLDDDVGSTLARIVDGILLTLCFFKCDLRVADRLRLRRLLATLERPRKRGR